MDSIATHVRAMLDLQRAGAITFDYGKTTFAACLPIAACPTPSTFRLRARISARYSPRGRGPFRWVALSGKASDIAATDDLVAQLFPENASLARWIELARKHIHFQGLPARICWLGYGERARFGVK
jgi:urocanate hydratase